LLGEVDVKEPVEEPVEEPVANWRPIETDLLTIRHYLAQNIADNPSAIEEGGESDSEDSLTMFVPNSQPVSMECPDLIETKNSGRNRACILPFCTMLSCPWDWQCVKQQRRRRGDDDDGLFPTGSQIYNEFRHLHVFEGASGRVVIHNVTGTRNYTTDSFVLSNVRPYVEEAKDDDIARLAIYQSKVFEKGLCRQYHHSS
jgi:hypothetical protein